MDRSRFRNTVIGPAATRTIVWTIVFLAGSLVALNVCLELRQPEVYDPEFDARLSVLRERIREAPDRPLLLVLGSSRITMAFRPETLPPLRTPDGTCALPFNLSHSGAGPLFELLMTTRLANEGIAPRWMVVELVPPLLGVDGESTAVGLAEGCDLPVLRRHVSPWKLYGRYLYERSRVAVDHRDACVRAVMPWLAASAVNNFPLYPLGGWSAAAPAPDPEAAARRLDSVRAQYAPGLQPPEHTANSRSSIARFAGDVPEEVDRRGRDADAGEPGIPELVCAAVGEGARRLLRRASPGLRRPDRRCPRMAAGRCVPRWPSPHAGRGRSLHGPSRAGCARAAHRQSLTRERSCGCVPLATALRGHDSDLHAH